LLINPLRTTDITTALLFALFRGIEEDRRVQHDRVNTALDRIVDIGLALCRKVLERDGGEISLRMAWARRSKSH
jgi:hypothetical protein